MNSSIAKVLSTALLCMVGMSFAHAADEESSKAEVKKQIQVCNKKKQGEWITYANKGVTFNGTCEPNAEDKLQFTFPAPPAGTASVEAVTPPENTANTEQSTALEAQNLTDDVSQQAVPETTETPQAMPSEQPNDLATPTQ